MFHLFTHAFFKALLFLGAGSVIHAMHHEQDMRNMGGLRRYIPFTAAMMAIGTLALTGFPLTAGYFSKDAIIEAAYASHRPGAAYAFLCSVIAACMTSFYSWRLYFLTFEGAPRWGRMGTPPMRRIRSRTARRPTTRASSTTSAAATSSRARRRRTSTGMATTRPHESPLTMLIPLAVLALGALFAGFTVRRSAFIGHGYDAFLEGRALHRARTTRSSRRCTTCPGWVALSPSVMMVARLPARLVVVHPRPGRAGPRSRPSTRCSTASCSTSGTSTSSTT